MTAVGTLELLARELAGAIAPLANRLKATNIANLIAELGLRPPSTFTAAAGLPDKLDAIAAVAADLPSLLETLLDSIEQKNTATIVSTAVTIGLRIKDLLDALDGAETDLLAAAGSLPEVGSELQTLIGELPARLADYAINLYLEQFHPRLFYAAETLGIVEREHVLGGFDVAHPPYLLRTLNLHRIGALLEEPVRLFDRVTACPDTEFAGEKLLEALSQLAYHLGANPQSQVDPASALASLSLSSLTIRERPDLTPPGFEIQLDAALPANYSRTVRVWPFWTRTITIQGSAAAGSSITLQLPNAFTVRSPSGTAAGEIAVRFAGQAENPDEPFFILGTQEGSRIEAKSVELSAFARFRFDSSAGVSEGEAGAEASVTGGRAIIETTAADGFITSILPKNGVAEFDGRLGYSTARGFYFGGSGSLETSIPLHATLGPISFESLGIDLRPEAGGIKSAATLTGSISIGPVVVSFDRIGTVAHLAFSRGNLGPVDLRFAFKPPSGLGISIDAGPITGGGFISFDEPAGRYSGVLQLEVRGIAIKAIGILDTKVPGGGYSFLIILSGEFSPIQLGLGFTLNGVGGLAGIHRTVAIPALQAGIRDHAADGVLFPKNPITNAPRIISDLQRFFPPLKEHYIFGPSALIGWGTPTLLTVKLGILLEFPPPLRIVLLGQLDCTLPDASAIVDLHVDVLGVIDFGAKSFALDGTIHDSRLGPYSLYGDFAVRLRWGSDPTFALAVGGFNPHFHQIPAGFPTLRRITLALGDGDNPRLTLQCYLALTSNSLQFGARAELYAQAGGFSVTGWIGFDALVYFHPFEFRVDLSAGFVLRRGSKSLGGIDVTATLTGPAPWHVWGSATISILFFDVSVSFDVTVGRGGPGALPSTDIWPALQSAMQTTENWSAVLPPAAAQVVTLRKPPEPTGPILDPVGTITLVERTAPLARTITRFADAAPGGSFRRFDLDSVAINTKPINGWSLTEELFAPSQFEQLSDDEKLSRPSFERMAAGMALPQLATLGGFVASEVKFRTVVLDSESDSHDGAAYAMQSGLLVALADVGSTAAGGIRVATEPYIAPGTKPKVALDEETYVIAAAADLTPRLASRGPKGAVIAALNEHLAAHPTDRGTLIVIPLAEAA